MRDVPALMLHDKRVERMELERVCPERYPDEPSRLEEYNRRVVALYLRDSACLAAGKNVFEGSSLVDNCRSTIGLMECYCSGNNEALIRSLQYAIHQENQVVQVKTEYHGKYNVS